MINEESFVLAIRRGDALHTSKVYNYGASADSESLIDLSHFIAHSLCSRFSKDETFLEPSLPGALETPQDGSDQEFTPQGGGRPSHRRLGSTDSNATIVGTFLTNALALLRWSIFLKVCMLLCLGASYLLSWLPRF